MKNIARLLARATCLVVPVLAFLFTPAALADTVAKIGDQEYETLSAALDAAKDGETIVILKDLGESELPNYLDAFASAENPTVTIDLNGHTISGKKVDFWPDGTGVKGTLILRNGTIDGTGVSAHTIHASGSAGDCLSKLILEDITLKGDIDIAYCIVEIHSGNYSLGSASKPFNGVGQYGGSIAISGGTFNFYIDSSWCATGYDVVGNIDGTYGVEVAFVPTLEDLVTDGDGAYLIRNEQDLVNFRKLVNAGNNFEGKVVKLCANVALTKAWSPIGLDTVPFSGNFDGQGFKISDVVVKTGMDYAGFFGLVNSPVSSYIKDLTIENVTVKGGSSSGGLAGKIYNGYTVSGIHVVGKIDISGQWYLGVIDGGMTYSKYVDCHVDGTSPSISRVYSANSANQTCHIGGIYGHVGEGASIRADGCTVKNITLESEAVGIGGIAGLLQYGNIVQNCSVENVVIKSGAETSANGVGLIAGRNHSSEKALPSYLINNTFESSEVYVEDVQVDEATLSAVGTERYGSGDSQPAEALNTVVGTDVVLNNDGEVVGGSYVFIGAATYDDVNVAEGYMPLANADGTADIVEKKAARIGDTLYVTLQEAVDEAEAGAVVEVLSDTAESVLLPLKSLTLKPATCVTPVLTGGLRFAAGTVPENTRVTIEGLTFETYGIFGMSWMATYGFANFAELNIVNNTFRAITSEPSTSGYPIGGGIVEKPYAIHFNNGDVPLSGLNVTGNTFIGAGENVRDGGVCVTVYGEAKIRNNTFSNMGYNALAIFGKQHNGNYTATSLVVTGNIFNGWASADLGNGNKEGRAIRLQNYGTGAVLDLSRNCFVSESMPEEIIKLDEVATDTDGDIAITLTLDACYWGNGSAPEFGKGKGKILVQDSASANITDIQVVSYYSDAAMQNLVEQILPVQVWRTQTATENEGDRKGAYATLQEALAVVDEDYKYIYVLGDLTVEADITLPENVFVYVGAETGDTVTTLTIAEGCKITTSSTIDGFLVLQKGALSGAGKVVVVLGGTSSNPTVKVFADSRNPVGFSDAIVAGEGCELKSATGNFIKTPSGATKYTRNYYAEQYAICVLHTDGTKEYFGSTAQSMQDAVSCAQNGDTVQLMTDVICKGVVFGADKKNITIDLNNYSYKVNVSVGSSGTETCGFQFLKGCSITFRNGSLLRSSASVVSYFQCYSDLTLENVHVDLTGTSYSYKADYENTYHAFAVNDGTVTLKGATSIYVSDTYINRFGYMIHVSSGSPEYPNGGHFVIDETMTGTVSGKIVSSVVDRMQIQAGTFTEDVSIYCVRGRTARDNENGTWTVMDADTIQVETQAGVATAIAMPFGSGTVSWKGMIDVTNLVGVDGGVGATTVKVPVGNAYASYYLNTGKKWVLIDGEASETVNAGDSIWITNPNVTTVTLRGILAAAEPEVTIVSGLNLVSFPTTEAVDIMDVDWTEAAGAKPEATDSIQIVDPKTGKFKAYIYNGAQWRDMNVPYPFDTGKGQKMIKAGCGFIYDRRGKATMRLPKTRATANAQ